MSVFRETWWKMYYGGGDRFVEYTPEDDWARYFGFVKLKESSRVALEGYRRLGESILGSALRRVGVSAVVAPVAMFQIYSNATQDVTLKLQNITQETAVELLQQVGTLMKLGRVDWEEDGSATVVLEAPRDR